MSAITIVPALELKFDTHSLPFAGADLAFCLTIRESALHSLDHVTKFLGDHPKQEHNTLLVYGLVAQAAKVYRVPIDRSIL